jgi:hypothetical protein
MKWKIIESSDSKSIPIHPQTETSSRTLSGSPQTLSEIWIWAQWLDSWEAPINIPPPPTALLSWPLHFPVEQALILNSKRPNSLSPRAFILSSCLGIEWSKDLSSLCDSPHQAHLGYWIFILHAYYSWSIGPKWLEVALELPLCVVSLEKFVLPIFMVVSGSRLSWWLLERGKGWERPGSLWTPQQGHRILC